MKGISVESLTLFWTKPREGRTFLVSETQERHKSAFQVRVVGAVELVNIAILSH